MAKFRKKPVVIEAFQFKGWTNCSDESYMPRWFIAESLLPAEGVKWAGKGGDIISDHLPLVPHPYITCIISTLEGEMRAEMGDWIIKGVKGEIYPCKPDIFAATYEPVGSE